jgi:hypothetical protein
MALLPGIDSIYQAPQGNPLGFALQGIADQRSNQLVDYDRSTLKMKRDYGRAAGDMVDRFSSRGTARSGLLGKASDRLGQDFLWNQGDMEIQHRRKLNDLEVQRNYAVGMGVFG